MRPLKLSLAFGLLLTASAHAAVIGSKGSVATGAFCKAFACQLVEKRSSQLYTGKTQPSGQVFLYRLRDFKGLVIDTERLPDGTLMEVNIIVSQADWDRVPMATRRKMVDLMVREFTGVTPARLTMTMFGGNEWRQGMGRMTPVELCASGVDEGGVWSGPEARRMECGWGSRRQGNWYTISFT